MHIRTVHTLGAFKFKTYTGWLIQWKLGSYLTFSVIGYYNGGFQEAEDWLN